MIINVKNANKVYGKFPVLQDINLQVPEGAAFALVGTNGAGKTVYYPTYTTHNRQVKGSNPPGPTFFIIYFY
jgi:ABC-type multidrug transport system ATPase subunit